MSCAPSTGEAFWVEEMRRIGDAPRETQNGLTSAEALARLNRYGENRIPTRTDDGWGRLLARQFLNPIEVILVAATVLSGLLGDWTDAGIILGILLISGVLGFVQERGAGKALAALLASVDPTCTALRDGVAVTVRGTSIVPGDVVDVRAGDVIPGDCLILSARGLTVDESALSGESLPVDKCAVSDLDPLVDGRGGAAFFGTHVASGSARLLVVHTGSSTAFAGIAAELARKAPQTGFERGMTRFGFLLTRVMAVLVVVIFVVNLLLQRPPLDSALFSLALAVGLTPQLLPAIVAISLSVGARAMAAQRVIVRRLDAIEDIGAMTILCSDKTGTMTEGKMHLLTALNGQGAEDPEVQRLAVVNATLQTAWRNPIDDALIASGGDPGGVILRGAVPYDFLRKRQSVLVASATERPVLITKGAVPEILAVCATAMAAGSIVPLDAAVTDIRRTVAERSARGERVLAVATRSMPDASNPTSDDERGMTFLGLLCFADPVKVDAADTIRSLAAAGVSVRMVTGDNHLTARCIAREVGLDATRVCIGDEIDRIGDAALGRLVETISVFCEMNPVQKERVIRAYRRTGHVVGYLGDGINDAPSLHAADIGMTVDSAVPVAKQAAAIVLLDKSLAVILDGVRQGRRTFANTMKYIYVNTSASFGNMLSVAVAAAVLPFLPLLAGQILLVNLLSDLPAMTIATDRVDEAQTARPQQWDVRLIRTYMIVFGILSSVFDLTTFAVLRIVFHAGAVEFRTAWLVCSVLTEVGVLFVLRTHGPFYRSRPGRALAVSSIVIVGVTLALPYTALGPPLQLVPLPPPLILIVIITVLAYLATTEAAKRAFWAILVRRPPREPRRRDLRPPPTDATRSILGA
ncbi:magnesium-translocating P-type ATPase [Microbacterium sp. ABRD28]|uniref:magnesium-translocating P-type ATPase n=1 Tax=Microbacterium sp. ABRD28 TaxID=2268461 RepID=UPI000F55541A|nr:magnesium-translocating P-type ATPase [Microbacterium sp. ABRD28]AZC13215.1 magnesium-translocating P-type ATPase [Microbacterium sp. ABRD28]